jgi:hypothetical protein
MQVTKSSTLEWQKKKLQNPISDDGSESFFWFKSSFISH